MNVDDEIRFAKNRLHSEIDAMCFGARLDLHRQAVHAVILILVRDAAKVAANKSIDEFISQSLQLIPPKRSNA